jgi:hypothetical protein
MEKSLGFVVHVHTLNLLLDPESDGFFDALP